jgi:hypothetical protein
MQFFSLEFWQSVVSNLIATFVGAGAGVLAALWINAHTETTTEREKKQKILRLILAELTRNYQLLEEFIICKGDRQTTVSIGLRIHDEVWQAFSDGGEIEWIKDPTLLNYMAETYAWTRATIRLSGRALDIVTHPSGADAQAYKLVVYNMEMFAVLAKESTRIAVNRITEALTPTAPWWQRYLLKRT